MRAECVTFCQVALGSGMLRDLCLAAVAPARLRDESYETKEVQNATTEISWKSEALGLHNRFI